VGALVLAPASYGGAGGIRHLFSARLKS